MNFSKRVLFIVLFISQVTFSQEGIAVYTDYLTDNYYLLHPSMAGAANCAKLRLSSRFQWTGQEDAPALTTLTFNGRITEKSGAGIVVYTDRNGYTSQQGIKLGYAYHLMFSRDNIDLNQLSFGVNLDFVQSNLDESTWDGFDPNLGYVEQQDSYFNVDLGMSYNYLDFYAHFTVRNAILQTRDIYSVAESANLRNFILNTGYVFGDKEKILWEPSIMFQYADQTNETSLDVNMKAYKELDFGMLWGGLSYRMSFDSTEFTVNGSIQTQSLQNLTPIVGINYKQFMFAYTYTYLFGDVNFSSGGFNLVTLGMNVFCKQEKYECNCPAIN